MINYKNILITKESHHNIEKERNDEKKKIKAEIDTLKTEKKKSWTKKKRIPDSE